MSSLERPVALEPEELDYFKLHTGDKKVYEDYSLSRSLLLARTELDLGKDRLEKLREKYEGYETSHKFNSLKLESENPDADEEILNQILHHNKMGEIAETIKDNFDKLADEQEEEGKIGSFDPEKKEKEDFWKRPVIDIIPTDRVPENYEEIQDMYKDALRETKYYQVFYETGKKSHLPQEINDRVAGTLSIVTSYAVLAGKGAIAIGVLSSLVGIPIFTALVIKKAKKQMDEEISKNSEKKQAIQKKYSKIINHK